MTEKNEQEKAAAERQTELLITALDKAKEKDGIWLNKDGKKAPTFFQKEGNISPFNAIILGLHSDQNGYKTNQYTLFSEAKKRGESVQTKEKGVPYFWYNWNEYHKTGVRCREVRSLFNIEQTTLPMVDKTTFEQTVKENGRLADRKNIEEASNTIRTSVNELIEKVGANMVEICPDTTGVSHYDNKEDKVYLAPTESYENPDDHARASVKQIVMATGQKDQLIIELATGAKLQELGISAKLSDENLDKVEYWKRELRENPCLLDIVERDVNKTLEMIHRAERGEQVTRQTGSENEQQKVRTLIPKHYYVSDEIKVLPNQETKEMVIVRDPSTKSAEVILPAGASDKVDNEIPGMSKSRIEHALQKEDYEKVTFFNPDGALGFRPDDSHFDGKELGVWRLNNWNLEEITKLDVTDAIRRSGMVDFDKILMLRDDEGHWALYMKPENEKAISVLPNREDVNHYFVVMKQGNNEQSEAMRQQMATKYYVRANDNPELKVDLFHSKASAEELAKIERVNIFKTKATEEKPSRILCMPTVDGKKLEPREVSPTQWQRMWLAEDMQDFKTHLAATLFADVLRPEQKVEEQKEEQEEKAQEETTKTETKAAEAVTLSPMVKQFVDLKEKHPDALLLFRCGDFYETYLQDAEKSSEILGITLTKSRTAKGPDGRPLTVAGFPYPQLDTYLPKLIRAGQRVAICDQLEVPKEQQAMNDSQEPTQEQDKPFSRGLHH